MCGHPYSGVPAMSLLKTLKRGERLERPDNKALNEEMQVCTVLAPAAVHLLWMFCFFSSSNEIMMQCWSLDPTSFRSMLYSWFWCWAVSTEQSVVKLLRESSWKEKIWIVMLKLSSQYKQHSLSVLAPLIHHYTKQAYIEGNCDSVATAGADLGVWTAGCQWEHSSVCLALHHLQFLTGKYYFVLCAVINPVPFYTQGFFIFFFHVIRNKHVC